MKKLVIWTIIGSAACFAGIMWINHQRTKDPGCLIGFALGNPQDGVVELHVVISTGMTQTGDALPAAGSRGQWIRGHFELRDDSARTVGLVLLAHSSLISERQARDPEFFLEAKLQAGRTYTLDYIPRRAESKRYRHTFAVPAAGQTFKRAYFDLVDSG